MSVISNATTIYCNDQLTFVKNATYKCGSYKKNTTTTTILKIKEKDAVEEIK